MTDTTPPAGIPDGVRGESPESRHFDGVVCFGGEDYWYHNRGHYDIQLMQRLSVRVPVLYVNSLGMRVPRLSEGKVFLSRLIKKLGSIRRGFRRLSDRFAVQSPIMLPGDLGKRLTFPWIAHQVRIGMRKTHISAPLVWVACPPGVEILPKIRPVGVVYQRTDRFEEYPNVDRDRIRTYDRILKHRADLTLFCSSSVMEEEKDSCRNVLFADHGVDFDRFACAGRERTADPEDMVSLPRPRVGFVGAIDAHTFDPEFFNQVVEALPDLQFVLVGRSTLPEGWCPFPNVAQLGMKPYEEVPRYMAACDVLIMPWRRSEWIRACNPVKLKEYLAVGRPVVSRSFDELKRYTGLVHPADDTRSFVREIRRALETPDDPEKLRSRVREETWEAKCETVLAALARVGLKPRPDPPRSSERKSENHKEAP